VIKPNIPIKKPGIGRFIAILDHSRNNRRLSLAPHITRCIKKGEIHEILVSLDNTEKTESLNKFVYLGFVEFTNACVLKQGDEVKINGKPVGTLAGFEERDIPNHMNLILDSDKITQSGFRLGLKLSDKIHFSGERDGK